MSLRLRLLAAFAYVLVLVIVALEVPLGLNVARRVDAEVRANAAGEAQLIAASAAGRLDEPRALAETVRQAADDLGGRVIVVNGAGRLLVDSEGGGAMGPGAASYAGRPEIRSVLETGRMAQGERRSETLDQDLLFTAVPILSDGNRVGVVRVTQSVDPITDRVWGDVLALASVGALALALGLGFAWVLAGTLSRPLRGLAATARRVEAGDLEARAEVSGATEQREVAVAFNDMTARLQRAFEAQREFVANASHQLRTPLTGLRLRLEAASLRAADPKLEADLAAAEREVDRLASLVTSLLALAREGEAAPRHGAVPVEECAEAAAERWRDPADRAGQRLELAGEGRVLARVSGDDLAIILDNLIENALRYGRAGGVTTVAWRRDGPDAVVAVLDDGPGLRPGEETAVFARFARGSAGQSGPAGTGLGLAVVEALARRHGGRAAIANRPAGGAVVEVRFRAAEASSALPTPNPALGETFPGRV